MCMCGQAVTATSDGFVLVWESASQVGDKVVAAERTATKIISLAEGSISVMQVHCPGAISG